jgi:general stress protein 26
VLSELVQSQDVAMLSTMRGLSLVSRPVTTLAIEEADTLWFMVALDSAIALEVAEQPEVCLSYIDTKVGYVSLRGHAELSTDRAMIEKLWDPKYTVWFSGPNDPTLGLLRVTVVEAEQWDTPTTAMGRIAALAKAVITGNDDPLGTHTRGTPGVRWK